MGGGLDQSVSPTIDMLPDLAEVLDRDDWQQLADHIHGALCTIVTTPAGNYRRRVFLSLSAAENAVRRARQRGQAAEILLCELRPFFKIPADPDLGVGEDA